MNDIREKIKKYREEKGLTQTRLGTMLGVSQSAIAQFENSKSIPRLETIAKIAEALDKDYTELLNVDYCTGYIKELNEYKKTGLTPDQIREMDVMYLEKCKQVNSLVKKCEELERRINERN